jgi:hypothetical protein
MQATQTPAPATVSCSFYPAAELIIEAYYEEDAGEDELDNHYNAAPGQKPEGEIFQDEVCWNLVSQLPPVNHIEHDNRRKEKSG